MLGTVKAALIGAGVVDGTIALVALLQNTAPDAPSWVGGGVSGATVSVALWWVYKEKVDRHDKVLDTKADVKDLVPIKEAVDEIRQNVHMLVNRALEK